MLFQDFQTTSSHHEFPRWSNHPPCNRSVPRDQKIREGKHLPVAFQYLVSLSHDLLRGPRKHRITNAEGRWQLPFPHRFAWVVCWLVCGWPQVWLSPGPTASSSSPTTGWAKRGARTLTQRSPHASCAWTSSGGWDEALQLPNNQRWGFNGRVHWKWGPD